MKATTEDLFGTEQWVAWDMRGTKVPINAMTGELASSTDPTTWTDYETALAYAKKRNLRGVGFVFREGDGYCGVDIDDCIVDGKLTDDALAIVQALDTYTEVSPSGTGVKCFGQIDRDFKGKVTGKVESYTKGRFFTFTGEILESLEPQGDDLSNLTEWFEVRYSEGKSSDQSVSLEHRDVSYNDDRYQRASLYLSEVEPSISGKGGDKNLYRATCKMVQGFELNRDDAIRILYEEFNPRCEPPWDLHDITRKVDMAFSEKLPSNKIGNFNNQEEEYKPGEAEQLEIVANLMSSDHTEGIPDDLLWLPKNTPLEAMSDYILSNSARDSKALAFTGTVAWACGLLSGKVMDESGINPNLYTITLAPSSGGKQAPQDCIRGLVDASTSSDWLSGKVTSDSAIGTILKASSNSLCLWDEIGIFLQKSKGGVQGTILDTLLDLWGACNSRYRFKQYADSDKDIVIERPVFGFAGWSTSDHFWSGLTRMHLRDGFAGRLFVLDTGPRAPRKRKKYVEPPQKLVEWVNKMNQFNAPDDLQKAGVNPPPKPVIVPVSEEAEEVFDALWDKVETFTNDDDLAVWGRAPEKARKIALAFHCMSRSPKDWEIDGESARRACRLVEYATDTFLRQARAKLSLEGSQDTIRNGIIAELKRDGGYMYSGPLLRAVNTSQKPFDEALRTLHAAGLVTIKNEGNRKRIFLNG